jgi:hypothetical protein
VKLAGIAIVNGILNNGLPFKTVSDLRTAFRHKRLSRLVGVIQNSQRGEHQRGQASLMFFYRWISEIGADSNCKWDTE